MQARMEEYLSQVLYLDRNIYLYLCTSTSVPLPDVGAVLCLPDPGRPGRHYTTAAGRLQHYSGEHLKLRNTIAFRGQQF